MKKYRCPNCKEIFIGTQEVCPNCGVKLHYANKEQEKQKPVEEAVSVSNFVFNDPDVIKHEEKFVPVTSIESMDSKDKDAQDAVMAPLSPQVMQTTFIRGESFYDGKTFARIGVYILAGLLFIITLGFGFPWAYCKVVRWDDSHTVIQGHRLKFKGKGGKLFGKFIGWILLTIITLGIYSFWVQINLQRWKIKNTEYVD